MMRVIGRNMSWKWSQRLILTAVFVLALAAASASGASLWQDSQSSVFADLKARNVGDLVTVIIVERTEASQSTQMSTGKDSSVELGPGVGILDFIPLAKASAKDGRQSGGQSSQGGSLSAKMTGKVVEVLPNGNLVIEGRQTITVNREDQEIVIRGMIRSADISPDNTILSTYVSDASISYQGSGSLGGQAKPGILTQILNWIF
ncbi:MAG: flagellar basal body L-ring protein FlgH [Firmicutes bacterium]|nr:flagellar basal body L-ring protein FlgH [Bacillota bacterium]